ncbi:hypothetical protein P7H60_03120 [Vagococcus carniphilus]|uniref:hypothetical protein n=1 Tax=Vagococcus carniphilus TaxID=218144 RepID=UPI00288E0774|nr:hypothetical protein [Vagococcus carniphilus]MDT2813419.1 hypothetical protein [Vagococcus carniphilus]MDT2848161.1 hypothetical protein [Vagococcus carniphilus]MDT2865163.1 hypothetical protein [Vagococcus carniphilus]
MILFKVIIFMVVFLLSIHLGQYVYQDFKKRKYILVGMLVLTIFPTLLFKSVPAIVQYLIILNGVSMVVAGFEVSRIKMSDLKIKF